MKRHPSRQTGRAPASALVITLLFVVICTIVTLGYLDSVRIERAVAGTHFERTRAATFAREGIERTVATLRRETVDPPKKLNELPEVFQNRKRNWISQPGALIVAADPPADQKQLQTIIPLSSGAPSPAFLARSDLDPVLQPPNLNVQTLVDQNPPAYLITDRRDEDTGEPAAMRLRWIYVRADGTEELDETGAAIEAPRTTDQANPIVGRFAYWADDESSKINYNLAWKRNPAHSKNPNLAHEAHPSRINLMGLTLPGGGQLTESMADVVHHFTTETPARYFNSYADARQASEQILDNEERARFTRMLEFNKFELTHYNHDPDTTFFGEDRILLTTRRELVPKNPDGTYARKFLDILRDDRLPEQLDPGILEHLAGGQPDWSADKTGAILLPNKFDTAVRTLMRYISEKKWPLSPTGTDVSFKEKYYPGTTDSDGQLGQIAVNIIDYVRAKESPTLLIAPLRFAVGPSNATGDNKNKFTIHPTYAYGAANSYQGVCRAPYLTEMQTYVELNPVGPPTTPPPAGWPNDAAGQPMKLHRAYFRAEFYLPPNYGFVKDGKAVGIDLVPDISVKPAAGSVGWFATWTETRDPKKSKYWFHSPNGQMVLMQTHSTNAVRIMKGDLNGDGPNKSILNPGKFVVVTKLFYRDNPWSKHTTLDIRGVLFRGESGTDGLLATPLNRWPRVNIGTQVGAIPYLISDPSKVLIDDAVSLESDDPRCNIHPKDWKLTKTGKHTLGGTNSWFSVGSAPLNLRPQQDTDADGKVSDFSFYMPPPRGEASNGPAQDDGRLTSIAELGYIHTGNNAKVGSTPWRTIRLQPNNYADSKTLPDWAFMDLFTVPNLAATGPQPILTPHGTSVGGRVNVNSHVEPFDKLVRDRGLVALLTGASHLTSPAAAEKIAANIYNRTLATGANPGKIYGYPWKPAIGVASNAFDTPGEICEIKGVADGGEKSEDLVREVASLITARGSVFSIYTIGQALKQTPQGRLVITGEQRQQAIIERYVNNRGTADSADDEVRFRSIYSRNLTP